MSANRLGALSGVGFIVAIIAGFLVVGEEPPGTDDGVPEIIEFYTDNDTQIWIAISLTMVAATLLVLFAGYLRKVLRAAEGEGHMLSSVVLAGAAVLATGAAIDATLSAALVDAADEVEPAAVQSLNALWNNDWVPFALGALIMVLAAGLSIIRHGALPKWIGWVAVVLAVVMVTPIGFVGFLGAGLWILVVSILLAMRADEASA